MKRNNHETSRNRKKVMRISFKIKYLQENCNSENLRVS